MVQFHSLWTTKQQYVQQGRNMADWVLTRLSNLRGGGASARAIVAGVACRLVATKRSGTVRVLDTDAEAPAGSRDDRPTLMFAPDGPNVIEHYARLVELLRHAVRIVVFDLPGIGFSLPPMTYGHTIAEGAACLVDVMDALCIPRAVLAMSCSNGFYALRASQIAPDRVAALCLVQTPCVADMVKWSARVVPWPVKVPVIGQVLQWWNRRATAQLWYGFWVFRCNSGAASNAGAILCLSPRRYRIALPSKSPAIPEFQCTAAAALDDGGCYCLASVVQGLASTLPSAASFAVPASVPVLGVWGERDRSHTGNFNAVARMILGVAVLVTL